MAKILLCDDDENVSEAVASYLKWHGFEVERADCASEMEEFLKKSSFDLLISSIFLPGHKAEGDCKGLDETVERFSEFKKTGMKILLTGPEQLEDEEWRILRKKGLYFLLKYTYMEKWLEKIRVIAGETDAITAR